MILGVIKNGEKELLVGGAAANVSYNNGNSGLTATDVQGAVDELSADINVAPANAKISLGNISTYTPTQDGYLVLSTSNTGSTAAVWIIDAAPNFLMAMTNGYTSGGGCGCCARVYKGRTYNLGGSATLSAFFLPLE